MPQNVYGLERDPNECPFKYRDKNYDIDFCKLIGRCKHRSPFYKTIHVGTKIIEISGICEPPKTE